MEAAVIPFPNDETTPPVTKICFAIAFSTLSLDAYCLMPKILLKLLLELFFADFILPNIAALRWQNHHLFFNIFSAPVVNNT